MTVDGDNETKLTADGGVIGDSRWGQRDKGDTWVGKFRAKCCLFCGSSKGSHFKSKKNFLVDMSVKGGGPVR